MSEKLTDNDHYKILKQTEGVFKRKKAVNNMVPRAQFQEQSFIEPSAHSSSSTSEHTYNEGEGRGSSEKLFRNLNDYSQLNNSGPMRDKGKSNVKLKSSNLSQMTPDDGDSGDEHDQIALLPSSSCKIENEDIDLGSGNSLIPDSIIENKPETMFTIAFQMLFPFLVAGIGMVGAGIVLDRVQHWQVFERVPEIFILVPALLGLKGNLEMTLASRLSTNANRGLLDDYKSRNSIVFGNIVLVEAQAMVVAFLASLVAMVLGWIPDGKWETNHAILLCLGSLLTGALASFVLGGVMIFVIIISRKFGINPDNVATPIAASLGDLVTLILLSNIVDAMYKILYDPETAWIGPAIIVLFCFITPLFIWLAHRNEYTKDVIKNGWEPVIAAMAISSAGGFILDFTVSMNPGIAVFNPVINGVGGNLVAVQASRISTQLHSSGSPLGQLPITQLTTCVSPMFLMNGKDNPHATSAKVMLMMVVPGQLLFLLTIQVVQAGHTTISIQFVLVYLFVSLIQVAVLLQACYWLVLRLWKNRDDPDNCAIPYLTALGDLLGTALLGLGFLFLWVIGDRDMDVGD